ncbi:TetR/AcrR family transcriptional regulator [Actinoallomurus iriomotensis]|uniref:TetR family transcriptional regulator n=1 Tax=Actinoallomurus iriomotensis TaxID=478107 RepID=A0A9W6SEJ6_9ACTN|nr:TetR/AcrR family transcriptional regulator [Actinoallomurus iriomotensis]GLY81067.1 TetR family transcriptional regulator [Actinoallomurus iriomotensis]GLY92419.1 TetR family transcriptional regulator [Actinoallomurus iriomotensis]
MLDACADILDENGYDGLSTTKVAQRADVAIGSVYQFFPDKRAIAQELALRNLEMFGERVARGLAEGGFPHWYDAVGTVIEIFVDMHRTVPGFRVLRFGDIADVRLLDGGAENNAVVADRLRGLLVEAFEVPDTEEFSRALAVAVEAADAVLKLAFRTERDGDPALLAEAEQLITGYLARHFES